MQFFWNFLLRILLERNRTVISIFSISRPFPTYFGLKWSHNRIVWYFHFFAHFMEFSITRRIETKRIDNFYFISLSAFSNLFWLEMKSQWYFLIFWFFFRFFWNFLLLVELERNGETIFIFSLSRPFQTYFRLKRSHNRVFWFFEFFFYFFGIFYYASSWYGTVR